MDALVQDLRYAIRQLVRSPGFTMVALLTLALGIGLNATMFSVVNAVLYRPLPVHEPDRLVRLWTSEWERSGVPTRFYGSSSWLDFLDLQASLGDVVVGLASWETAGLGLGSGEASQRVTAAFVAGDFFEVWGARAMHGRTLRADETMPGAAANAAVISESLWRTALDGDPAAPGRSVMLGGESFTVVGIVADEVLGPLQDDGVDVVLPLAAFPRLFAQPELFTGRSNRWLGIIGRLRPGVEVERAQVALTESGRRIAAEHPAESGGRAYTLGSARTLLGLAGESQEDIRSMALVLMTVVGIVLVIAGANVANLLLARASHRGREIAIRLSLGAGRRRVMRQLLTESVLLALAGASLALLLALWGSEFARLFPLPAGVVPTVDERVLAYTLALGVATGIVFGLAPALRGTRAQLAGILQSEGGRTIDAGRSRLRTALVAGQVALSFVLLVASGLLGRSVLAMRDANPGFDADRVLVASVPLDRRRFDPPAAHAMYERILERASAIPGVRDAALSSKIAFGGGRSRMSVEIPGYAPAPGESMELEVATVSPGWLRTMGIPIVRGEDLSPSAAARNEIVVNETMARRYWPGRDAVGATLQFGIGRDGPRMTVVGVARDAQLDQLTSAAAPIIVRPIPPDYGGTLALHLRTDGDPALLGPGVREALRELDPDLPLAAARPLAEVVGERSLPTRIAALSVAATGALALLLAAIGLYGVMAFLVAQRTREIGIRMALGAEQGRVLREVLADGTRVVALGVVVGTALALAASRGLAGVLYGVRPWDPVTFAGIATLLALVALAASWFPARRAAAVEPSVALRAE